MVAQGASVTGYLHADPLYSVTQALAAATRCLCLPRQQWRATGRDMPGNAWAGRTSGSSQRSLQLADALVSGAVGARRRAKLAGGFESDPAGRLARGQSASGFSKIAQIGFLLSARRQPFLCYNKPVTGSGGLSPIMPHNPAAPGKPDTNWTRRPTDGGTGRSQKCPTNCPMN